MDDEDGGWVWEEWSWQRERAMSSILEERSRAVMEVMEGWSRRRSVLRPVPQPRSIALRDGIVELSLGFSCCGCLEDSDSNEMALGSSVFICMVSSAWRKLPSVS